MKPRTGVVFSKWNMRRVALLFLLLNLSATVSGQQVLLPVKEGSLRFAVIGDSGTGGSAQYEVGRQLALYDQKFPFTMVLMLGDNLYGGESPRDFEKKFERPYQPLLNSGVKFYAALGNHDDPSQRSYKFFNMNGERFYTFRPKSGIRFFALDSNYMDPKQLEWLETQLQQSASDWKICFFHHPLYSSGEKHGSSVELRKILEPIFIKYGVNVVFSGHEHFYERIKPQSGIYYFISGAAGQLRRGNVGRTELTAKAFDSDNHFMLVEIAGDEMYFETVSRSGQVVDSGVIARPNSRRATGAAAGKAGTTKATGVLETRRKEATSRRPG
jgi:hypothetical protein